jgi:hypothetical protein
MASPPPQALRLNTTRWVIYLLVALAVLLPYVLSAKMPFTPSKEAKNLFDVVDSLKSGDHVLIAFDFDPSSEAELRPMGRALLLHCFKKGVIPVMMTFWPQGLNMDKDIIEKASAEAREKWGKDIRNGRDFVFLGFRPSGANLILNMGENLKGAFDKDVYQQPTQTMPGLAGVSSLKDMKLVVDLAAGATIQMWIAYGSDRFGFPLGAGTTAVQAPDMYPFMQSNQVVGLLGGLRGAADYEKLLDASGAATRGMQAQSFTHLLLVGLIVFANVVVLVRWFRERKD